MPAKRVTIGDQEFIIHDYTVAEAFDVGLLIADVLSEPLGRILGREVEPTIPGFMAAVAEAGEHELSMPQLLSLFNALRRSGGSALLPQILAPVYGPGDTQLNTVKSINKVFKGARGLLPLIQLVWETLRTNYAPLVDAADPLAGRVAATLSTIRSRMQALTSIGGSGGQSSPSSEPSEKSDTSGP